MTTHVRERRHAKTIFEKMARHTTTYRISILGKEIPVMPGVFSPKYVSDVKWFAREVPRIVDKRSFLEIGTGTGVIALMAGLNGAGKIVATDINAQAVKNAKLTFRLHRLRASVRCGDVFQPIKANEKFDVIFWNHPFHASKKAKDMLERGGYDQGYKSLRAFFAGAKEHLSDGGEALLGTSKNARLDLVKVFAKQYGYTSKLVRKDSIPSKHRHGVKIDVRVYSFRQKQH